MCIHIYVYVYTYIYIYIYTWSPNIDITHDDASDRLSTETDIISRRTEPNQNQIRTKSAPRTYVLLSKLLIYLAIRISVFRLL